MSPAGDLPVVETFHSLQGEGMHAGRSAFFIRLGGCTVGCSWCDTKHSWPEGTHPKTSLHDLATEAGNAVSAGAAFVVITGGEPLHHNLNELCGVLRQSIHTVTGKPTPLHLETSGVDPLSGSFDWITLSPKQHKPPTSELLAACDELKVIVHDPADLTFASSIAEEALHARSAGSGTDKAAPWLLVQPGHGSEQGARLSIEFVMANPSWRLSIQTHKILGVS